MKVIVKQNGLYADGVKCPVGECEMRDDVAIMYASRGLVEIPEKTLEVATPEPKKRGRKPKAE